MQGETPTLLNVRDFAARAALSEPSVWKLLRLGKLHGVKIGAARRIPASELARLAREGC